MSLPRWWSWKSRQRAVSFKPARNSMTLKSGNPKQLMASIMKKYFCILAMVALGLTACNTNVIMEPNEEPAVPSKEAQVYHFCIHASMGGGTDTKAVSFEGEKGITSTFLEEDRVYVYNVTKEVWARDVEGNYAYLQPSDLQNGGKSCTLEGELTFRGWNGESWVEVEIDVDDTYELYYNLYQDGEELSWSYECQDGSIDTDEGVTNFDFAKAEDVTLTKEDDSFTLGGSVQFRNIGSMFRQHISFIKDDEPMDPEPTGLRYLLVSTERDILGGWGVPHSIYDGDLANPSFCAVGDMLIGVCQSVMDANGDVYFALTFDNTEFEEGSMLHFMAEDYEGNVFTCEKEMPAGGLQNSKYYHGTLEMAWDSQHAVPTVTASNESRILPWANNTFYLSDGATISGSSEGFDCYVEGIDEARIILAGNGTASHDFENDPFIYGSEDQDLTIFLASNYMIDLPASECAIWASGNLKLATTGGTYQLTIKVSEETYYGLHGMNFSHEDGDDVSNLAADGFSVELEVVTDDPDSIYYYVFTVTPN